MRKQRNAQPLSEIVRKLRKGEISTIANNTGFSASHVCNVLHGRRNNTDGSIIAAADTLTRRRR